MDESTRLKSACRRWLLRAVAIASIVALLACSTLLIITYDRNYNWSARRFLIQFYGGKCSVHYWPLIEDGSSPKDDGWWVDGGVIYAYYSGAFRPPNTINIHGVHYFLSVSLWFIGAVSGVPGVWIGYLELRRFRGRARGLCVECGYDLRSSPDRCPECGSMV